YLTCRRTASRAVVFALCLALLCSKSAVRAQVVDLPRAIEPNLAIDDDGSPSIGTGNAIIPLPRIEEVPHLAYGPYGYSSDFPAPIVESAEEAIRLPALRDRGYGGPVFSSPGFENGDFEAIITEDGVMIPGEEPLLIEGEQPLASQGAPSGWRKGFVQQVSTLATYLPKLNDEGMGQTDFENMIMVGVPFPTRDTPLVISPGFDFHLLDGPTQTDLPPRLYDMYTQFRWLAKINERWSTTIAATPGYYTDYQNNTSEAFRITGQAFGIWEWRPESMLIFGVVYLDRDNLSILPAGGLVWKPNETTRLDLIFPRPRYLKRFRKGSFFEDWWYIAGEFGGGQWAIQREDGSDDVFTLTDYRISAGLERKSKDYFFGGRIEAGYVFGRQIEYRSNIGNFDPSDTLFVRAGLFY
ncbi:MAG: DUF6268 family outer membrane beta-barrel protein, partial [Planctomycetota bacterium]|nr:DUF6268 family outer membrane beta-barrel protein [Planctomycetota bacterium]